MKINNKQPGRVKAALLNWLGVPIQLTDAAFWEAWNASGNAAGQVVNQNTVMSLSAAWACTRLIAETVATLPIKIYERTPNGRREASNHPLYPLLHSQPNANSTAVTYWESVVSAMLLRGCGCSEMKFLGNRLVALDFLVPDRLVPKDKTGKTFVYTERDNTKRDIPRSRIFRVPGYSLDGYTGVSTIRYGAEVFGSALAASSAANSTFKNGLMPTIGFKYPHKVKREQREEFREVMAGISGSMNAGKAPVLEDGMDVVPLGINPSDAQLLESRTFSVEEVCRWFRVDPSMVGHGGKDSNWGTGLEQKVIGFITFTLRTWLTRIEQAISKDLFTPEERSRYYAEFSIEGLLRADSAARAAFYSVMVNNGIWTRDEVRVKENLAPRGGNADVLTVQSAMTPLDDIGRMTTGDTARAALAAWLNNQEDK